MIQVSEQELNALLELAGRAPKTLAEALFLEQLVFKLNLQAKSKKNEQSNEN